MTLSEICIRRPVLAIVMSMVLTILGIVSFFFLGVREYPAVDPPVITVSTRYPGANAEIVDSQITEPLEQVINGIAGIRVISSSSTEGRSTIRVEFDISSDLEQAANDVRDKVFQAVRQLPDDADPPTVEKADADADPIIFMMLRSDRRTILEISNLASTVVKERLQTIPGVSSVRVFGEKRYAMRLWMDPAKLAAHQVTPIDVFNALQAQNVDLPSGRIEGTENELAIRTFGRLTTAEEFNRMIIRQEGGRILEFRDIGYASLEAENLRSGGRVLGVPNIGIAVIPQPNTNAISIADEFAKRLGALQKEIPGDYTLEIGYDFTTNVRRSIAEVRDTVIIAFLLVALIIYVFLRDWRSTIIPVIAIPVSLISAFFIMYLAGFTINVLTLIGILLAVGLVVDDAIVVLENIYSKVEMGLPPLEAAVKGTREIYFAVLSTTVALATVFVPILFMQGLTGRLFREFGMVVAGAVTISSFVALTLTPMMCRNILRRTTHHSWFHNISEPFFRHFTQAYSATLAAFLRRKWITWPIVAGCIGLIAFTTSRLPTELAPLEDRSNITVNFRGAEGASFDYTARQMDVFSRQIVDEIPEISRTISIVGARGSGANNGFQNIYLVNPDQRARAQKDVFRQLSAITARFDGLRGSPSQPPTIGSRRGGSPVQFILKAPNFPALLEQIPRFMEEALKRPELQFADVDVQTNNPEVSVKINRARAAELDISVADIGRTLQLAFSDSRFGYFLLNGRQYQVIGQLQRSDRNEPGDLQRLHVRSRSGAMVPLDNLISFEETVNPPSIFRFNRFVAATISAQPGDGYTLGQALDALDEIAAQVLPESFSTDLAGQSRDFKDSSSSLFYAFLFALLLIYLVLSAQFESFIDPFIILFTVPLSVAGALLSLWVTGYTLNVFSQIGIIMLIGLVTKNGILIVEFANQRKASGLEKLNAVHSAAVARFRPILMTSLSTIFGILPIALQIGSASGSRTSLGVAVVGGLIVSGFLTLYVIPAIYVTFSRSKATSSLADEIAAEQAEVAAK